MRNLIAAAALCLAPPAFAQSFPQHTTTNPDEFTLEVEGDNYAYVEYHNSADRSSGMGYPRTLTNGDLTVELEVTITQGPEILRVIPPEGWRAEPPTVSVADGSTDVIELFRGEFLGY
ncbi:MAG: hypothetical protein V2I82_01375 [Halieaceae bacterium]|jgi:hypothetical protein|nr:hypothetical protein [Halieaceae bacterium]